MSYDIVNRSVALFKLFSAFKQQRPLPYETRDVEPPIISNFGCYTQRPNPCRQIIVNKAGSQKTAKNKRCRFNVTSPVSIRIVYKQTMKNRKNSNTLPVSLLLQSI